MAAKRILEKLLLTGVLELQPLLDRFAQPSAAFQITQHCFGQNLCTFAVPNPFQLLLATCQMLQRIFEPKQIHFPLAHGTPDSLDQQPCGNGTSTVQAPCHFQGNRPCSIATIKGASV
jgi:hypothetical protein